MLSVKFHGLPVYYEKYIKANVKEFNGVVNKNFQDHEVPKEDVHYTCIACTSIDSVMKIEKNNHPQVYLEECKYKIKKKKLSGFIDAELQLDSGFDSEQFTKILR